jgi:hypothetical protein
LLLIGCALFIISPWLAFFPERLAVEKTDALEIAKERENEPEPQSASEWLQELVRLKSLHPIYNFYLFYHPFSLWGCHLCLNQLVSLVPFRNLRALEGMVLKPDIEG